MIFKRFRQWSVFFFSNLHLFWQLMYGAWRIFKVPPPIVTIFGGSRFKQDDPYAVKAHEFAQCLVNNDISVLTGGGPGIMQAASCGAIRPKSKEVRSIGIGVTELAEKPNPCVQDYFELDYFFARKWLLTRYSVAFVVFPGGFGTLDELSEVLTLIQTKKLPRLPIVLIGTEYWDTFMAWVNKEALKHNLIAKEDLDLFILTDDIEYAFNTVRKMCKLTVMEK